MTSGEIVKAKTRHRWLMAAILLALILLGSLLAVEFRPYSQERLRTFQHEIRQKPYPEFVREMKWISSLISLAAAVPLMVMGAALLYQSTRALAAQQYPYPGMMIMRDTKLREGSAAIQRGRITFFVGAALLVLGLVIGLRMYVMLVRLIPPK